MLSAELNAERGQAPEEIGALCAHLLCEEIERGGCLDTHAQYLACILMVLGPEDASQIRIGKLSPFTIAILQDLKSFFGVTFKIQPDDESQTILYVAFLSGRLPF